MNEYLQFSTDEAAFLYSLNILHITENGFLRVRISFIFISIHFKVYAYILNFLFLWFLLFYMLVYLNVKKVTFYSHKYIKVCF